MTPLDAIALGLSVFYVAYVVARTAGPFDVFKRLRDRLPLGGLTACVYCVAFWAAFVLYAALLIAPPVVYVCAAAGAAAFLYRYTGGDLT